MNKWNKSDIEVEYSGLQKNFEKGSEGIVKPKGNSEKKFTLTEVIEHQSFTYEIKLPFWSKLEIGHVIQRKNDSTEFTHIVNFNGLFGSFLYIILGKTYKKQLPIAMNKIKELAES